MKVFFFSLSIARRLAYDDNIAAQLMVFYGAALIYWNL